MPEVMFRNLKALQESCQCSKGVVQDSEAMAELQAENKRLAGLLADAEVAAEEATQLRDALEAKNEAQALQVCDLSFVAEVSC